MAILYTIQKKTNVYHVYKFHHSFYGISITNLNGETFRYSNFSVELNHAIELIDMLAEDNIPGAKLLTYCRAYLQLHDKRKR